MSRKVPKVSVIMPAYNVERYVGRAIESMLNQTLDNIEVIVVDDGSTDRTGQIADRAAERDIRVEVLHTKNQGAPAARNAALDIARGNYVYFADADDWAERDMLRDMLLLAESNALELVVAGFYIDTYYADDNHLSELKNHPSQVYASQEAFRADAYNLFDKNLLYTPWNKLFLRARIEELGLRFRPTFWDDFPFCLDFVRDVERVAVMEKAYYHFIRSRKESETARWRPDMYEKREEEHTWMLDLYEHWGLEDDPASTEMVQRRYIERLIGCIENVCNPQCTMSREEKLAQVETMITSPRAQTAVEIAVPRSKMMQRMLAPIRSQNAKLAYTEGRVISFVKRHNTRVFASLKARR